MSLLLLVQRLGIAAVFFMSATKVDGLLTVNDTAFELFRTDLRCHSSRRKQPPTPRPIPSISSRSANARPVHPVQRDCAFLVMTLVIEIFVYPDAWPTHLSWAGLLLPLIALGGGKLSLDRLLKLP